MIRHLSTALLLLVTPISLIGCGGVGPEVPPAPTAAIAVIYAIDATTKEPLKVEAEAVCGGVRGIITVAEESVVLRDVPFGTNTPPTQPLTVSAPGYKTFAEVIQINTSFVTSFTAELEPVNTELTGTMTGIVLDKSNRAPVTSALLKFIQTDAGGTSETRGYTDKSGQFVIRGIDIGLNHVTIEATGFVTATMIVNVVQDAGGGVNSPLEVTLLPGSTKVTVNGKVTDAFTALPLSGVILKIGALPETTSGVNGEFEVKEVSVGAQILTATLQGYDDYEDTLTILPGMSRLRIAMTPSAPLPPAGPYNVRGTVTLIGQPDNSGALVTAVATSDSREWARVTTPASGTYTLFIPPGQYRLTVNFGGRSVRRSIDVPGGGRVLDGVDFVLTVE